MEKDRSLHRSDIGGLLPIPDPTDLTTKALMREVGALRDLVFQRLDAMDKAVELFDANLTRVPTEVDKQIANLRELIFARFDVDHSHIERNRQLGIERFQAIDQRFEERDTRIELTTHAAKEALEAALHAAEKAVNKQNEAFAAAIDKSEASSAKQIEQLQDFLTSSNTATNAKIDDQKERILRLEGEGRGKHAAVEERQSQTTGVVQFIGVIISMILSVTAIASVIVTAMTRVAR